MSRVVGIISGKGGVGKTSVAANLGTALRDEFGRNIAIIDANTNAPHLAIHMKSGSSVSMPANSSASKMKSAAKKLSQQNELVIMDLPPGLGKEVVTSVSAADAGLVVTTPDFPSVAAALKSVNLLERMRKKVLGIVVNNSTGGRHELTPREIESICGTKVIATIPGDVRVPEAISRGVPAVSHAPNSRASVAFKRLAGKMVGQEYERPGILARIKEFFSRTRR